MLAHAPAPARPCLYVYVRPRRPACPPTTPPPPPPKKRRRGALLLLPCSPFHPSSLVLCTGARGNTMTLLSLFPFFLAAMLQFFSSFSFFPSERGKVGSPPPPRRRRHEERGGGGDFCEEGPLPPPSGLGGPRHSSLGGWHWRRSDGLRIWRPAPRRGKRRRGGEVRRRDIESGGRRREKALWLAPPSRPERSLLPFFLLPLPLSLLPSAVGSGPPNHMTWAKEEEEERGAEITGAWDASQTNCPPPPCSGV